MFRHKSRTFLHNLRLAVILSFVAGIVNVTGVLSVKILTTNITGHFAFFAEELVNERYAIAISFLLFIIAFMAGAFVSNMLIETVINIKPRATHTLPVLIEISILLAIAVCGQQYIATTWGARAIACVLLFAMGMQNALVTQVSQATVRTTHLTGLFTDLGIELSQIFFYRQPGQFEKLRNSIYLRLSIIVFFFMGCVLGGYLYSSYGLKTLFPAAVCLVIAMLYSHIRYYLYLIRKRVLR